jgi:hypothetical protein
LVEPDASIATENPSCEETASTTEVAFIDQDVSVPLPSLATEKQISDDAPGWTPLDERAYQQDKQALKIRTKVNVLKMKQQR